MTLRQGRPSLPRPAGRTETRLNVPIRPRFLRKAPSGFVPSQSLDLLPSGHIRRCQGRICQPRGLSRQAWDAVRRLFVVEYLCFAAPAWKHGERQSQITDSTEGVSSRLLEELTVSAKNLRWTDGPPLTPRPGYVRCVHRFREFWRRAVYCCRSD